MLYLFFSDSSGRPRPPTTTTSLRHHLFSTTAPFPALPSHDCETVGGTWRRKRAERRRRRPTSRRCGHRHGRDDGDDARFKPPATNRSNVDLYNSTTTLGITGQRRDHRGGGEDTKATEREGEREGEICPLLFLFLLLHHSSPPPLLCSLPLAAPTTPLFNIYL